MNWRQNSCARLRYFTQMKRTEGGLSVYELSKDRYLELKHYSKQWTDWADKLEKMGPKLEGKDPTAEEAATIADLTNRIFQIEKIAREAFRENFSVGFYAVTHGLVLKTESYRLYFWLLDKER